MLRQTITHVQIVRRTHIHTRILLDMTDMNTHKCIYNLVHLLPLMKKYRSPPVYREHRHDSVTDPTPEIIKGDKLHFIFVQRDRNLLMLKQTHTHLQIVRRTHLHTHTYS